MHSCLSPCASLDMSPSLIVKTAIERGLNCIALTDHNSAGNCAVTKRLCDENGILFFPGIEVTTLEEVHMVCLFSDVQSAKELDRIIYSRLPDIRNDPERFGYQVVVNEKEEVEGFVEKYLGMASTISIDELRDLVIKLSGAIIPAHIDRPSFSIVSQLGFLSGTFSAVELSRATVRLGRGYDLAGDYPTVTASDAHFPHEIGCVHIKMELEHPEFRDYCGVLSRKEFSIVSGPQNGPEEANGSRYAK